VADGHDGWMEDFGEYSPSPEEHNLYPLRYHRAVAQIAAQLPRPPARFVRSGWTRSAAYSPLVWGGDPTTGWGFDGLRSAVIQGLSMGLSGVAFWGSDIGGFFTLGDERLTPELLIRWIQFGALSPLMRTKSDGVGIGDFRRPQVWDADVQPHWRRWASFHTLLIPYLLAAAHEYAATGMPLMRHHALTDPDDAQLAVLDDQYRFGPDLLVAPVLEPGARERAVRLPAGDWIDLWRSVIVGEDGEIARCTPTVLQGGRTHVLPAPLEEIPILVRAEAEIAGLEIT
jgi:alpha-glucosidase (family GH31 glycosyl hydrolase)